MYVERYLPTRDGWIWYQNISAEQQATPLLVLHGSPGAGSAYFESLKALADQRSVIFYDQLGCGRSEEPDNPTLWNLERFVQEIGEVREWLHLFGHSWGGGLATEYLLTQPPGVSGIILASTSASLREYSSDIARLKRALPPDTFQSIEHCEQMADYQNPVYKATVLECYHRHLCWLQSWSAVIAENIRRLTGNVAYETLQGPMN